MSVGDWTDGLDWARSDGDTDAYMTKPGENCWVDAADSSDEFVTREA